MADKSAVHAIGRAVLSPVWGEPFLPFALLPYLLPAPSDVPVPLPEVELLGLPPVLLDDPVGVPEVELLGLPPLLPVVP